MYWFLLTIILTLKYNTMILRETTFYKYLTDKIYKSGLKPHKKMVRISFF